MQLPTKVSTLVIATLLGLQQLSLANPVPVASRSKDSRSLQDSELPNHLNAPLPSFDVLLASNLDPEKQPVLIPRAGPAPKPAPPSSKPGSPKPGSPKPGSPASGGSKVPTSPDKAQPPGNGGKAPSRAATPSPVSQPNTPSSPKSPKSDPKKPTEKLPGSPGKSPSQPAATSLADIAAFRTNGEKAINAYNAVRLNPRSPDTKIVDNVNKINPKEIEQKKQTAFLHFEKNNEVYFTDNPFEPTVFINEKTYPEAEIGFKITRGMEAINIAIRPNDPEKKMTKEQKEVHEKTVKAISSAAFAKSGQFILESVAFKAEDKTSLGKKIPVHEMVFQGFQKIVAGDDLNNLNNLKNLKAIFIVEIINKGYLQAVTHIYKTAKIAGDQKAIWKAGTEEFNILAGTEIVLALIQALTNHHNALGNKKIAKIITVPEAVKGQLGLEALAIVLE